jgi:A/G-specific adenine glycosylase
MNPTDWWEQADLPALRRSLLGWYRQHGRDLPWRKTQDPYQVWVSEIMLQQTTVATVRSYYDRFLSRFPNLRTLADADEQEVLHLWQGLGYYRRARNMHRAARVIRDDMGGQFPTRLEEIERLPGLGKYTARAVATFALGERVPIIEANTRRLWSRVSAADGDPSKPPLAPLLWQLAEKVLPTRHPADFNQAAMDVGSMICTPKTPSCGICPLRDHCQAYALGRMEDYPQLPPRKAKVRARHCSAILWNPQNELLLRQRPADGTWAGLWEFPLAELAVGEDPLAGLGRILGERLREGITWTGRATSVRHAIMHYQVELLAREGRVGRGWRPPAGAFAWVGPGELRQYPLSTPQRRLVTWLEGVGPPPEDPTDQSESLGKGKRAARQPGRHPR